MNKARRKAIENLLTQIATVKEQLDAITEEERDAFESLPESLQYSERGDAMSEAADDMEQAASDLEDIMSTLQDVIDR